MRIACVSTISSDNLELKYELQPRTKEKQSVHILTFSSLPHLAKLEETTFIKNPGELHWTQNFSLLSSSTWNTTMNMQNEIPLKCFLQINCQGKKICMGDLKIERDLKNISEHTVLTLFGFWFKQNIKRLNWYIWGNWKFEQWLGIW